MTTFAFILSILSFLGFVACFTVLLSLYKSLGKLTSSLEKMSESVDHLDSELKKQKAVLADLKEAQTRPLVGPAPANLVDGVVLGLVGAAGNRLPKALIPVLHVVLRSFVGYLGRRKGKTPVSRR